MINDFWANRGVSWIIFMSPFIWFNRENDEILHQAPLQDGYGSVDCGILKSSKYALWRHN